MFKDSNNILYKDFSSFLKIFFSELRCILFELQYKETSLYLFKVIPI